MAYELYFKGGVHICTIKSFEDCGNYYLMKVDIMDKNDKYDQYFNKLANGNIAFYDKKSRFFMYKKNPWREKNGQDPTIDFQNNFEALRASNPERIFSVDNPQSMIGLEVVCVWRKEEWKDENETDPDKQIKLKYSIHHLESVFDYMHGAVKPMADYLKYSNPPKKENNFKGKTTGARNVNVNNVVNPVEPPKSVMPPVDDTFDVNEDDIPF